MVKLLLVLAACGGAPSPKQPDPTRVELAPGDAAFEGMCDASGAVPIGASRFVVADDEDSILRIYDVDRGGPPISTIDISEQIMPGGLREQISPTDEVDIEAATRIGDIAFWISSHARRKSGEAAPARLRFFATTVPAGDAPIRVIGVTDQLLAAMLAEPRFGALGLQAVSARSPIDGGFNIEGMTRRTEGGVWIAFRSPLVDGKALVVGLLNPREVIAGEPARFLDPVLLDLGGLGIRAMSNHRGRYVIIAGHPIHARRSVIRVWDGVRPPSTLADVDLTQFNAEAFVSYDTRDKIMLLSDDGSVTIDGTACKRLADPARKRFHGRWISIPR